MKKSKSTKEDLELEEIKRILIYEIITANNKRMILKTLSYFDGLQL